MRDVANFSLVSVIRRWSPSRELSTELCWGCREGREGNDVSWKVRVWTDTWVRIFCVVLCLSSSTMV